MIDRLDLGEIDARQAGVGVPVPIARAMVKGDEAMLLEKVRFAERTSLQLTGVVDCHRHRIGAYARRGRSPRRVDQDAFVRHETGFEEAVEPCVHLRAFSHVRLRIPVY